MALRKILEKKWSYTLYESNGKYFVSVICGDVGVYELNIPLGFHDVENAIVDDDYLDKLASKIASDPKKFALQHVENI